MSDFYYAGIMTGTSLDAADAILCKDSGGDFTCIAHAQMAMPSKTARRLRHLNDNSALAEAMDVANVISHLCAQTFLEMASTPAGRNIKITALGCHGQTILHRPKSGWSVQLLNGALLAELTRVNVVCDFRARDIAAGGQGAPLAPLFHREIFIRHAPCAVVNLGGIANITTISENGDVKGWDIGPANMLMDAWYRQHHTENYDDNGKWAQSGTVVNDLLNQLLRHPFLLSPPPKSCGREQFDLRHFKESLASYPAPDAQATLLEWSAKIIAETIGRTNAKRAFYAAAARVITLC